MDKLVESLELPSGCGKVVKARRLNRKNVSEGSITWIAESVGSNNIQMTNAVWESVLLPHFPPYRNL